MLVLICLLFVGYAIQFGHDVMERGNSYDIAGRAGANLQIGMQRSETQQYLSEAWRHYDCESSSTDVYVFGSRNLALAGTLYLRFEREADREVLVQIASVEYYMLNQFDTCKISER